MFDLTNIRVKEYLRLPPERVERYLELQKVLKPRDEFRYRKAKPLHSLSFGTVRMMEKYIQNPTFDQIVFMFNAVFGVKRKTILSARVVEFFYAANWIIENLIKLVQNEEKALYSEIDPLLYEAGIERLARFSDQITLRSLAREFGTTMDDVEKWRYSRVLSLKLEDKITNEIRTEYDRLKK